MAEEEKLPEDSDAHRESAASSARENGHRQGQNPEKHRRAGNGHKRAEPHRGHDHGKSSGHQGAEHDDDPERPSEEHDDKKEKNQPPWYRRPPIVGIVVAVVIAALVGGALIWRHSRDYESTDDAFIDVPSQRVSPQVNGRVTRVLVNDNQDVTAGQVLVELDPADFQNRITVARAAQAQAEAEVAEAQAQEVTADAQREQASANESVAAAHSGNATDSLGRLRALRGESAGAVSQEQFDRALTEANSDEAQLQAAQRAVAAADAQINRARQQTVAAHAAVRSAAAQVAEAELNSSYSQIKAGVDGRIARKTVAPGNMVAPGAELMAVVPREVFVTANFKETQLRHMRRGQPVTIKVDSYPDLELRGRVDSVQPATGQVFDLLPSQNASGNWVKVIQRIPVKITLDQLPNDPDRRLAPGMSVTARVSIR